MRAYSAHDISGLTHAPTRGLPISPRPMVCKGGLRRALGMLMVRVIRGQPLTTSAASFSDCATLMVPAADPAVCNGGHFARRSRNTPSRKMRTLGEPRTTVGGRRRKRNAVAKSNPPKSGRNNWISWFVRSSGVEPII